MSVKTVKLDLLTKRNSMITIVGRDMGAISASDVESVLDSAIPEAKIIVDTAIKEGKYKPLIVETLHNGELEKPRIKSYIIMNNGMVYPSSFRVTTLMLRIKEATTDFSEVD